MVNGTLFVISAASGAGKTSLVSAVLTQVDELVVKVCREQRKVREKKLL